MKKILLALFALHILLSAGLDYLAWRGDTSPKTRAAVRQYFTEEDIAAGARYARAGFEARTAFTLIQGALLAAFAFSSLRIRLEKWCDRAAGGRPLVSAAIFIALVFAAWRLIALPFSFYVSFVLEHRFGFSVMGLPFWLLTQAKMEIGNLLFVESAGILILYTIGRFPRAWVALVPATLLAFRLLSDVAYPYVFIPLFHETRPLPAGGVRTRIEELTGRAGIPVSEIRVLNESAYSTHTNAFFLGWGGFRTIYLYDTLLAKHGVDEIAVITAHEMGHWVMNHTLKDHAATFLFHFAASLLMLGAFTRMKKEKEIPLIEAYSPSSIPLYLLILLMAYFWSSPALSALSRAFERQADACALAATGDARTFISMKTGLARHNRSRLDPHPLVVFARYSHPPVIERIMAAEKTTTRTEGPARPNPSPLE